MIRTRVFDVDPILGQTKLWHYDDATDTAWIETRTDQWDKMVEFNHESRKHDTGRFNDGLHLIGQIPLPLYHKLQKRNTFQDQKAFAKWWNSDEAVPFKTREMSFGRK